MSNASNTGKTLYDVLNVKEDASPEEIKKSFRKLSLKYQDFGWEKNSGYGTKKHIENIYRLGPTIHHRKTFEPIKSLIHS